MERQQLLEDLLSAYYDARKNKRNTINQLRFEFNMEHEIISLCDEILERRYEIRPSICFVVDKPVKRAKRNFFLTVKKCDDLLSSNLPGRSDLEKVRASLNSYLGILKHYCTYNIRRKGLLNQPHAFLRYGYLDGKLMKYTVLKRHLKSEVN